MAEYSEAFKANMVRKLLAGGRTATALSAETGISQPTLSRWLRDARDRGMPSSKQSPPRTARRPSEWKPEEKLRVLAEADGLSESDLGMLLRREGLHETDLAEWRRAALAALGGGAKAPAGEARRVRELEKQLHRKDRALAEAAALLVLQKKKPRSSGGTRTTTRRRRPTNDSGAHR
jgi:transposase-like protein